MTDKKSELALLLRDYFTRETCAAVLQIPADDVDLKAEDVAGFSLYPVKLVIERLDRELQSGQRDKDAPKMLRSLVKALMAKWPDPAKPVESEPSQRAHPVT